MKDRMSTASLLVEAAVLIAAIAGHNFRRMRKELKVGNLLTGKNVFTIQVIVD